MVQHSAGAGGITQPTQQYNGWALVEDGMLQGQHSTSEDVAKASGLAFRRSLNRWIQIHPELSSWGMWCLGVLCFAAWVRTQPWLMWATPPLAVAIHTLFYALVALVVREWFAIRWARRS
jgi:hypothetical protein